jgi:putative DNA methylase
MTDRPRLIEVAFPLKQASLDSVHEKNVRHGHISTLHIWPARRPLAACRAAIIAALLPDPGTHDERRAFCERIAGKVIRVARRKTLPDGRTDERLVEETHGGVLHWGRESGAEIARFRQAIRETYGGRAPRVCDPFAGGGALVLEALRLGCEASAVDVNPVAWFILKCTVEYPQALSGRKRRLPDFALRDREFMKAFFTAQGFRKLQVTTFLRGLGLVDRDPVAPPLGGLDRFQVEDAFVEADLAWHVRAWGRLIQMEARRELAALYPVYADFEPLRDAAPPWSVQPSRLAPVHDDGTPDLATLNLEFESLSSPHTPTRSWLDDPACPRWVAKPVIAYLWARTVRCRNCRATIPLLKTRWLSRGQSRVLLTLEPVAEGSGIQYGVQTDVPPAGGNNAQRREHDRRIGQGTMSRSGAWCPSCGRPSTVAMSMEDIQSAGQRGALGEEMIAAVVDGPRRKEFRPILEGDRRAWQTAIDTLKMLQARDAVGPLLEPIDPRRPSPNARGLAGLTKYGITSFDGVFNARQQAALFSLAQQNRRLPKQLHHAEYDTLWTAAICDLLALTLSKLADYNSKGATWNIGRLGIRNTFARFALPMTTDYAESNAVGDMSGGLSGAVELVASCVEGLQLGAPPATIVLGSADGLAGGPYDAIVTDPPYYDAIPYADISDFFYIWLRRAVGERHPQAFGTDVVDRSREIVQHAGRLDGDNEKARALYETRMADAFTRWRSLLADDGRLVIVFAHKHPAAWETLVTAIVKAGFVVNASWPIQTERQARSTALASAALSSSIWLVCRKRPSTARAGWDNHVLAEMRARINERLRDFWDAGIRGPDFVWAATGPALEAYSRYPAVKKADAPGQLAVPEFLRSVRRMVIDFVIGRVLSEATRGSVDPTAASSLDDVTTYYLLHRHDFKFEDAPAGACILYAVSCNLSESDLADRYEILVRSGGIAGEAETSIEDEVDDGAEEEEEGSGSTFRLRTWSHRENVGLGGGHGERPVPLIDQVHRLMHLWRGGDLAAVDRYVEDRGLRRSVVFHQLLQALIELATEGSDERPRLEALMNHLGGRGVAVEGPQALPFSEGSGADDT